MDNLRILFEGIHDLFNVSVTLIITAFVVTLMLAVIYSFVF